MSGIEEDNSVQQTGKGKSFKLGYLVGQWARQAYDELGVNLLLSFFWFAVICLSFSPFLLMNWLYGESEPPFGARAGFAIQMLLLAVGLWGTATGWLSFIDYMEKTLTFQYPGWRLYWRSLHKHALSGLWLLLLLGGSGGILLFDLRMFPLMFPDNPYLGLLGASLTAWMGLFVIMVQTHLGPFLAHQDKPFLTALKRSALVAVWKPLRAIFISAIQLICVYACLRIPPMIFILPGFCAVLSVLSLLILLEEWRDPYEKTREAIRAGA